MMKFSKEIDKHKQNQRLACKQLIKRAWNAFFFYRVTHICICTNKLLSLRRLLLTEKKTRRIIMRRSILARGKWKRGGYRKRDSRAVINMQLLFL